ncbi:MAG: cation:proton antiporter [Bacteroidales bacterium]
MPDHILLSLVLIVFFGFAAQWISWRIRIPSILLLLLFGIIVGPFLGLVEPDQLMGELLIPFVTISVAIILFEGGLTLKLSEFKHIGKVVSLLITLGMGITWVLTGLAVHWLFDLDIRIAALLGAILTVTGPTVVGPLLRNIRPRERVGSILKWEGILIDPMGAMLSILVFEAIILGGVQEAATAVALGLLKTVFLSGLTGGFFALLLTYLIKKYWIPDYLEVIATLTAVVTAFLISDYFQEESGLLSATVMGIILANQKQISIKPIKDFKENLSVLMIPVLFILLSSRLTMNDIELMQWIGFVLLGILIVVVRPLAVFLSTINSGLKINEKLFISFMAPRGIVAAAMASVFALELTGRDFPQIEYIVPLTFFVIIGTVIFYSISSPIAARYLNISQSNPDGVIIAGGQEWALDIASILKEKGFRVIIVDTIRYNIKKAKMMGLDAVNESIISEKLIDKLNLEGIGKLIALTSNDEANAMAVLHFSEIFSNENLFQISPDIKASEKEFSPQYLRGRFLFGEDISYSSITNRYSEGAVIKSTKLTEKFSYEDFKAKHGDSFTPLFLIDSKNTLIPFTSGDKIVPEAGSSIIALLDKGE